MSGEDRAARAEPGQCPNPGPGFVVPPLQSSHGIDAAVPNWHRVWEYWLGGKEHYPVDREMGDAIAATYPVIVDLARGSRHFYARVVRFLAGQGITQFLDIGVGLPLTGPENTHQIARQAARGIAPGTDPQIRVVYVDDDLLALAFVRALLRAAPPCVTGYVNGDLRDPGPVITRAGETLDFAAPVGVLLRGLHFLTDAQAQHAVGQVRRALPTGSYVVIVHQTTNVHPGTAAVVDLWNSHGRPRLTPRTPQAVSALLGGMEPVDPGAVPVTHWRYEHSPWGLPVAVDLVAALGRQR